MTYNGFQSNIGWIPGVDEVGGGFDGGSSFSLNSGDENNIILYDSNGTNVKDSKIKLLSEHNDAKYDDTSLEITENSNISVVSGGSFAGNGIVAIGPDINTSIDNRYVTLLGSHCGDASTIEDFNVLLGSYCGENATIGANNFLAGHNNSRNSTTKGHNVILGDSAGNGMNSSIDGYNTIVGESSARDSNVSFSCAYGANSLQNATGVSNTVAIGLEAGRDPSGNINESVFIGSKSGRDIAGDASQNTAVGYESFFNGSGENNTLIGHASGNGSTNLNDSILIGSGIISIDDSEHNIIMGNNIDQNISNINSSICLSSGSINTTPSSGSVFMGSNYDPNNSVNSIVLQSGTETDTITNSYGDDHFIVGIGSSKRLVMNMNASDLALFPADHEDMSLGKVANRWADINTVDFNASGTCVTESIVPFTSLSANLGNLGTDSYWGDILGQNYYLKQRSSPGSLAGQCMIFADNDNLPRFTNPDRDYNIQLTRKFDVDILKYRFKVSNSGSINNGSLTGEFDIVDRFVDPITKTATFITSTFNWDDTFAGNDEFIMVESISGDDYVLDVNLRPSTHVAWRTEDDDGAPYTVTIANSGNQIYLKLRGSTTSATGQGCLFLNYSVA